MCVLFCVGIFFFIVAFWRRRRQLTDQFSSTVFRIGMIQSFTSFVIYSNDKRSQKYSRDTQYSHTNHNLSGCRKWRPVISAYKSKECKFESSKFWILWEMWWRLVSGEKIMYAYIFVLFTDWTRSSSWSIPCEISLFSIYTNRIYEWVDSTIANTTETVQWLLSS